MWQFKKTFLGKKKQIDIRSVRDYLCKGFYSLPYTLFEGYFRFVHVCGDQNEFYEPIEKIFPDILYAQNPQRKFALHFSGGYDSSLLAKIYDRDDADFMHLIGPETAKARVLAEGLKGRMREFSVNADDFIKAADEVTSNIEEPYAYNDVVFTYLLSKYARDFGHDLVITGDGGDYVFGGINVGINSALSSDIWKTLDPNTLLGLRSFQPLMHSALKSWADATLRPSEVTMKKPFLRKFFAELNMPQEIINQKKVPWSGSMGMRQNKKVLNHMQETIVNSDYRWINEFNFKQKPLKDILFRKYSLVRWFENKYKKHLKNAEITDLRQRIRGLNRYTPQEKADKIKNAIKDVVPPCGVRMLRKIKQIGG